MMARNKSTPQFFNSLLMRQRYFLDEIIDILRGYFFTKTIFCKFESKFEKMKNLILRSMVVSLLFFGCSDNESDATSANAVAEFEIEGMVCEMGCGASLRKGLYETGFVSEVKVDYAEENPSNSIKVYFNKENISTTEMKDVIESLNENQFKASLVDTQDLSSSDQEKYREKQSGSSNSSSGVEASTRTVSFPNLTELLNSLIH